VSARLWKTISVSDLYPQKLVDMRKYLSADPYPHTSGHASSRTQKWLQMGTLATRMLGNVNIDDLERPKWGFLVIFCNVQLQKSELR